MAVLIFDSFLASPDMIAVFDDDAVIQKMLDFEAALARAQAAEGLIPAAAARAIEGACHAALYDGRALIQASRAAGSLAIPLVKALTRVVAASDPAAATHVHWGSTSQDVIDTGMVLATRDALRLLDEGLHRLTAALLDLAERHMDTPVLARTLMQPAQVTRLGFKFLGWAAPLVRARDSLAATGGRALQLQLGGAIGTLAVMGDKGPAVARRVAQDLRLAPAAMAWHTQRDEWVRLGLEVAVLAGSLGKIATDLSLLSQAEIGELAEPSGKGRGGSSAMPHKRNPVSSMIALAGAARVPQHAAALLAAMGQQHERGLGNWQAELAEWPGIFLSAHGALSAMNEAMAGLQVNPGRMRANIDALQGLIYAEAVTIHLGRIIGRPEAHELLEELSAATVQNGTSLYDAVCAAADRDPRLQGKLDRAMLSRLFDPLEASAAAKALAADQLKNMKNHLEKRT